MFKSKPYHRLQIILKGINIGDQKMPLKMFLGTPNSNKGLKRACIFAHNIAAANACVFKNKKKNKNKKTNCIGRWLRSLKCCATQLITLTLKYHRFWLDGTNPEKFKVCKTSCRISD